MDMLVTEGNDDPMPATNRVQVAEVTGRKWVRTAVGRDLQLLERTAAPRLLTTRPLAITEAGAELACPWCTRRHVVDPSLIGATVVTQCRRGLLHVLHEIPEGRR